MAFITSENYKELVYSEDSKQTLKIIINNKEIDYDYVKNIKLKDDVFDNKYFSLGSATMAQWELELDNDLVNTLGDFSEITIESEMWITETTKETIPLGTYIVKRSDDISDSYTKYTLYDYMDKFDVEVDFSSIVPCTRYEVAQFICNYCGVPLENTEFINGDVLVDVYDNSIKAKTYMALISERAGGFAKINRNNKLEIKSYGDVDTIELPINKLGEYKAGKLKTISKVIYENGIQKFEAGDDTGETIFLSSDNLFTCSQAEVDAIYNNIKGLKYQSLEVKFWGDAAIDTGDIIKIGTLISFAQKDWSFSNGFYGSYKTSLEEITKSSNITKVSPAEKRKKVSSTLDEENAKIKQVVELVDGQNKKITSMESSLDGVKTSVEKQEQQIIDLSNSIEVFSVDIDADSIIIATDNLQKPTQSKNFIINYFAYCKGEQVTATASTADSCTGINISFEDGQIIFETSKDIVIPNVDNNIVVDFLYEENEEIFSTSKRIGITLATAGKDGIDGKDGTDGKDGNDGAPGIPGANGTSSYFYVKYSVNSNGNPMVNAPTSETKYMGVASTSSPTAPTEPSGYEWSLIQGEGTAGKDGENGYLHVMYSENGTEFTPADNEYALGKRPSAWIGQYSDHTEADSTNFDDYVWYKFTEDIDDDLNQMKSDISSANTAINNNYQDLNKKIDNCATSENLLTITEKVEEIQTSNSATLQIVKDIQVNGVSQVKTEKGFTFNDSGLNIDDSNEPVKGRYDAIGIDLTNKQSNTTILFAGFVTESNQKYSKYKGQTLLGADLAIVQTLVLGNHSQFDDYTDEDGNEGTGPFEI